jgi:lantibiotic modifying enzyme
VPRLIEALFAAPELSAAIGPGGFHGFGGICYAVARIATLLGDSDLVGWLAGAMDLLVRNDNGEAGFAAGRAGGLAAMLSVHAETGLAQAARLAKILADRLVESVEGEPGAGGPVAGFAYGPAGIGYVLLRYAATGPGERYAAAGRAALRRDRVADANHAWCSGISGTVIARSVLTGHDPVVDQAVELLGKSDPLLDSSLCHGELGVVEALTVLAAGGHDAAKVALEHRAARMLGALAEHGPRCGTPEAVPAPGLLTGLAGIGYGLLRLGFPEQVPSVLTLDRATNVKLSSDDVPHTGRP